MAFKKVNQFGYLKPGTRQLLSHFSRLKKSSLSKSNPEGRKSVAKYLKHARATEGHKTIRNRTINAAREHTAFHKKVTKMTQGKYFGR